MALTATATPFNRSWDETIVPTLRKRLESESRLLAKRISAASIGSDDLPNPYQYNSSNNTRQNTSSPTYYSQYQRPSAIPRPSMQSSRPSELNGHALQSRVSYKRPRTLSQPFPFEPPSPDSVSRSTSPQSSIKPTRIPMKSRNGSISSNAHSTNTTPQMNGRKSKDTYYAIDAIHEGGPQHKPSVILNEQPPFSPSSDNDVDSARFSVESEERPFEHWYRGDLSRNGGVGELRVAKRKEMLDIASFGHSSKRNHNWADGGRHSRNNSRALDDFADIPTRRRASARESLYLDPEEINDDMVVDERPLTDVEDADVEPEDMRMSYYFQSSDSPSPSPPPEPEPVVAPPRTSSRNARTPPPASRIPTPSRHMSDPPRTPTPTEPPPPVSRGSSEPLPPISTPSSPYSTRARSQTPTKAVGPQTPKARAKVSSPTPSSSKKQPKKSRSPPSAMKRRKEEDEKNRRSVATYPTPEGEDMEHAIPVWTQPVEGANWDEVVLPVVARKNGLDSQYEMQDGSPRPAKQQETILEPAPGTFRYDYSKYKPPRADYGDNSQSTPMDEFGQLPPDAVPEQEEETPQQGRQSIEDRRPIQPMDTSSRTRTTTSPAPFSHYGAASTMNTYVEQPEPQLDVKKVEVEAAEESGAGCCKCVIM